MNILFLGTPTFAVASLKVIHENNYNIVGVVTMPDKAAGRGMQLAQSEVKQYAIENNLPLFQPEKLRDPYFLDNLQKLNIDLGVVVAFRMMPEVLWSLPRLGTINLHGSLLPQYRGAAPIHHAIMNGDKETGCTTFFLKHEIDTGNIIDQCILPIDETDTTGTLHDKMMILGAELLLQTIKKIESKTYIEKPQLANETLKHAPKITKEMALLNFNESPIILTNKIKAMNPFPVAYCQVQNQIYKIWEAESISQAHNFENGQWLVDHTKSLKIACNGGFIDIKTIQSANKKKMPIKEFLLGFNQNY